MGANLLRRAVTVAASAAVLAGLIATPAAAAPVNRDVCKTVKNTDGTFSFAACVFINSNDERDDLTYRVDAWRVWNIPLARGGHTDLLTNVVWHGLNWNQVSPPQPVTINFGNIAEGDTDDWYEGGWYVPKQNTVWVEVHDPFAPKCQRVFFNEGGGTAVTTC
jgi:hypothetical protein